MTALIPIAANLAAIAILIFGVYFPRHHRRDLAVAYLGVNVGVLAVATALSAQAATTVGLGLGLFGVLSIIRLRSDELAQHEVAYYFASLAIGLIAGIGTTSIWLTLGLMGALVATMFVGDHPKVFGSYGRQVIQLDRAIADPRELRAELSARLDADVQSVSVQRLDMVNDTTLVDVRYRRRQALPRAVVVAR
ncbi:DUF4956 domain-containing protein [Tessaracoccus caeni]|uniref:DUF4956 domain-containing protein n=1 Tax=Tessaracoccus caeni TaxID=3031239 RepID=UPI0023DCBB52|nr:DUF4956 domain-containing protein [Tessaracoccus caeni]MDF1488994.1 DUF4956 domain-containing protein [Tessaracoccus caeni]